jgi:glycosyltransferase involved in cell wall biosynthesis
MSTKETKRGKITIVLPAYNEAGNIAILLEKIYAVFVSMGLDGEVILINDGSTDDTGRIARACANKFSFIRVFDHYKNLGLTKTLSEGFQKATGEVIIFLCSDLQSDPQEDIPKLLEGIDNGADVVVGWRQGRKRFSFIGSKIFNRVSKFIFNLEVHDLNWIKAFRKEVALNLKLKSDWHRFIVPIAVYRGYKVTEVKTNWYPRKFGKSKYNLMRVPITLLDMIILKIEMDFIDNPMRFFGSIGFLLFCSGIVFWFTIVNNFSLNFLPEYSRIKYFFITFALLILSLMVFCLGLFAEFMRSYSNKIWDD